MESQITTYRYLDYFAGVYRTVRCQLLEHNDRTAKIKLLGFGPKGRQPGSLMRVHIKSLDWKKVLATTDLKTPETSVPAWHAWTDV